MARMDNDVIEGNGDGATDDGNGNGNGDGDGVDTMDDDGQRRQRRLAVNTTINGGTAQQVCRMCEMFFLFTVDLSLFFLPPFLRARNLTRVFVRLRYTKATGQEMLGRT
jgi:hypothetical protein